MFYTYAHYKPQGGLFYIGKGKRRRAYQMDGRNSHWNNIVNKYGKPHVELLASWKTEAEAFDHEKLLISCFRDMGYVLANKADGGGGTSGFSHPAWNRGVKLTDAQKAKSSVTWFKKGQVSPMKGKKRSKETIEAHKLAMTGRKISEQHKANISKGLLGRIVTEETRKKISIGNKNRPLVKCHHCDKMGDIGSMTRWHMDNCKHKEHH